MKMKLPNNKRLPLLHKLVSANLVRISILLATMKKKKPIFLKKLYSRKLERLRLLKHYNNNNYGFLGVYQFDSPSTTPLIHCHDSNAIKRRSRSSIQDNIYSMFFSCKCFGIYSMNAQAREENAECRLALEALPAPIDTPLMELEEEEGEEDCVDERAQKFIEWFYEEMRLQRQESF